MEREGDGGVEAPISSAFSKRLVSDVAQEIGNAVGKMQSNKHSDRSFHPGLIYSSPIGTDNSHKLITDR